MAGRQPANVWPMVIIIALILLLALPTIVVAIEGGFHWREIYSSAIDQSGLKLVISKRAAFPAWDLVDPSMVIRGQICEASSGRALAEDRVEVMEDSDLSRPIIERNSDAIRIRGFDRRSHSRLTLISPENGHGN